MAVGEDRRVDLELARRACAWPGSAPQSRLGQTSWISIRAGRDLGGGVTRAPPKSSRVGSSPHLGRSSGVLLHLTSLPGGTLGPTAFEFVDWLAAAGQTWWQMLPLGPPDRNRLAVHAAVGVRRLAGAARGARRAGERRGDRRPSGRAQPLLDRRLGALRRRRARSPTRCGSSASGARCARTRPARGVRLIGDLPIYVAPGSRRPALAPGALPLGRRRRRAAGQPERVRAALAQPALRLAGAAAARLPLVDRSACGARSSSSTWSAIDHFRGFVSFWEVPAGDRTAKDGRWHRGPGAAVFRAAERELGAAAGRSPRISA